MPPERPIAAPQDAFAAAAALRNQLDAVAPGRYTVGVGLKQTGGEFTDRVALFVSVPDKRPAGEVAEGELVPPEFGGYVTDVVEQRPTLIDDIERYAPLRGGIEISRPKAPGFAVAGGGTLGAIVRRRQDRRPLLLTCAHVVGDPPNLNVEVFQPAHGRQNADVVGTVVDFRSEGSPLFMDCAVIQPNSPRGVQMTVEGIGPVKGVSTEAPALGEVVKKRGKHTLLTHGFVVRLHSGAVPAVSTIEVSGGVPFVSVFAGGGDSGSVLLNASDQVIGLLFAIPRPDLGDKLGSGGLAMPIHHVQEGLQVDVAVAPGVSSIKPTSAFEALASLGRVVIEGWGFDASPQVLFDQVPAAVLSATQNRLEVLVPLHHPGTVDVRVANAAGDFSEPNPQSKFTY